MNLLLLLFSFVQVAAESDIYIFFIIGCVSVLVSFFVFKLFVAKGITRFNLIGLLINWIFKTNNKADEHKQVNRKLTKTEKQLNKD